MNTATNLFERTMTYPDFDAQDRLGALIGLDEHKERLAKMLGVLVNRQGLQEWNEEHHPDATTLLTTVIRRPPLLVLAGDVGSGKTELAETIGDRVARREGIDVTLLPLSLATRGEGRVGEMTKLVGEAFSATADEARKLKSESGKARGAVILLIDEADALVQSREASQMHHEDRAGVNAFIRGIDRLANERLPSAVIVCTNRLASIDPAVQRRAADILSFSRPNDEQRRFILKRAFDGTGLSEKVYDKLVTVTGPEEGKVGFTFSDLTQRLIPAIVLDAYPDSPVSAEAAIRIARSTTPTPAFQDQRAS